MNEELDYAEMLEIPVETVSVNRKERRRKEQPDLQEQLVQEVNEKMETGGDPAYAESTPIARTDRVAGQKQKTARRVIIGEFVAVCALCAAIFLTNIFMADSAINTFVRGLFHGNSETVKSDTRAYSDFKLSPIVSDSVDADITVSSTGVLSFVQRCSVYSPCDGKLVSVNGNAQSGYTVEIQHSDSFSTIVSGLDTVYSAQGEKIYSNVPLGFSDGEGEVRVMLYSDGNLLSCLSVNENTLAWS